MEAFAKESWSVKLFPELKSMPVRCQKKVHWFISNVCNPKFAAFWCFATGQHIHVNGCFFANIDVFSIGIHRLSEHI